MFQVWKDWTLCERMSRKSGWCCQEGFKQQRGSKEGRLETPRKGRRKKRVNIRPMKTPNLNPEAMSCWIGHDTITWCRIGDDHCLALLDTGVTINGEVSKE